MTDKKTSRGKYLKRAAAVSAMIICVLVSLLLMQYYLCIPNSFDENRVMMLHKEPENTIDVLLIGSSATYSGFASAYAYEKYGFTSYPYAIGGATCTMWKPALMDTLRTQKPKLVVVDVFGGGYDAEMIGSRVNQVYTIMAHYPMSAEKIALAKEIDRNIEKATAASLLFPMLRYHLSVAPNMRNIKARLRAESFGPSPLKGIETKTRIRKLAKIDKSAFETGSMELEGDADRIVRDFLDYCKEKDIQVLFVKYPLVLKKNEPEEIDVTLRANRILEIAEEYGYPALNLEEKFYEIGLKENGDFYNHGHANVYGQKKVTEYLAKFIRDEMGIGPTDLSEENRAAWDESVRYYHGFVRMAEDMIEKDDVRDIGDSPEIADKVKKYMKD